MDYAKLSELAEALAEHLDWLADNFGVQDFEYKSGSVRGDIEKEFRSRLISR